MKLFLLILKGLAGLVVLVLLAAGGFYVYLNSTWKKTYSEYPQPDITARADSATVARGEYLVHAVAHCAACHQDTGQWSTMREKMEHRQSGAGQDLVGGTVWEVPLFGRFVAANITPDRETGIGAWSDGELARVLRSGVGRDGRMAPFMTLATGPMADEDLLAVVSYLRSRPPVPHINATEAPGVMGKFVLKGLHPRPDAQLRWVPPGGVSIERGDYLANGPAACFTCHSQADPMHGFAIQGPRFQGDAHAEPDMVDPDYEIVTPNLTPDSTTGHIAQWDEDMFVLRFQGGPVYNGSKMPWDNFALLTEDDLRSLYRYLHTLPPVQHDVGPIRRRIGWKPGQKP